MKKIQSKNTKYKIRHYIEFLSIIMLIGIIIVNSLYLNGYNCSELTVSDGLIINTIGYSQDENNFIYNPDEKC